MNAATRRPRISLDVQPEVRRRLRLAAAKRDLSVRDYVLEAIEERLVHDLAGEVDALAALNATVDPVLGDLWDNERDGRYDHA